MMSDLASRIGFAPSALEVGQSAGLAAWKDQSFGLIRIDGVLQVVARDKRFGAVCVDYLAGKNRHRLLYGGGKGQDIAKACGLNKKSDLLIWDMTAGMGQDLLVLASLGARIEAFERNPVVYALLADGLERASMNLELMPIVERIVLHRQNALQALQLALDSPNVVRPNVIYLDPMFPERQKSAQVKKEMQLFHDIVGLDEDSDQLLPLALQLAQNRVVVKRPKLAGFLNNQQASLQFGGKTGRFDVYTKAAIT